MTDLFALLAFAALGFGVVTGLLVFGLCAASLRGDALDWQTEAFNLQRALEVEQGRNCELRAQNRELRRRLLAAMDAGYSAEVKNAEGLLSRALGPVADKGSR